MSNVIKLPDEPAHELDVLRSDAKRSKQRQALQFSESAWNLDDHPELAQGGEAYVEKIRSETDERFEDAIRRNQTP
jgi:hypothetical protein